MNFIASGLDLAAGDEVVSTDQEHGGGISPLRLLAKRRGIVVKELKLLPALAGGPEAVVKLFADAMTPRTRVMMFSHITSGLGILLAGPRAVRARPRARRAVARRRRAGGGPDPRGREGAGLRRLRGQPAQVAAGAQRHGLPLRPAARCRSASGRRWRASRGTTAPRAPSGSCSTAPAACRWWTGCVAALQFMNGIGHGAHRALGRDAHEAAARRAREDPEGAAVARRPIRAWRRPSRPFVSKASPRAICRTRSGRRRFACARRATTAACGCRRICM